MSISDYSSIIEVTTRAGLVIQHAQKHVPMLSTHIARSSVTLTIKSPVPVISTSVSVPFKAVKTSVPVIASILDVPVITSSVPGISHFSAVS